MATIQDALAVGWKLLEARDLARAEQVFRKVVEIDPTVAQAWFLLGAVTSFKTASTSRWPATSTP